MIHVSFSGYGIAEEYPPQFQWAADWMGPPCDPIDGWVVIDDDLYCMLNTGIKQDFIDNQAKYIPEADDRWTLYYGSLHSGPFNAGCYADCMEDASCMCMVNCDQGGYCG